MYIYETIAPIISSGYSGGSYIEFGCKSSQKCYDWFFDIAWVEDAKERQRPFSNFFTNVGDVWKDAYLASFRSILLILRQGHHLREKVC